ncbi:hypothetical protein [Streptomyces sp. NPDC096132]|uniref:hypothetical protein n=1 Tax=Streptomyces sp. NPDC096132 TaxID=3366075 RepID=UPI00380A0130
MPKVRAEAIDVVAVDATGEALRGYSVVQDTGADDTRLGWVTSPAAKGPDVVY